MAEVLEKQDHTDLVGLWGDLIHWPSRLQNEGPFLIDQFHKHNCKQIYDACLGDGVDTIYLLQHGFSVVSNEPDNAFRKKALKNAAERGFSLEVTQYDWRDLDQYAHSLFDAIICLGNSFTYLFDADDREQAIKNFHSLLRPGGILVIDERNYPYMLANRDKILNDGAPTSSKKVVYCGQKVTARPIVIEESLVVMNYRHQDSAEEGRLSFYPFKKDELRHVLEKHFEYLEGFSDFVKGYDPDAGFFQHVCRKTNPHN